MANGDLGRPIIGVPARAIVDAYCPTVETGSGDSFGPRWATKIALERIGTMGSRWLHTAAVAERAVQDSVTVPAADRSVLISAAWLHDIGYAPTGAATGFHPLDGARYLESLGAPGRLVNLVANHSCARYEAERRDLADELAVYQPEVGPVADALVHADMTTGPTGRSLTVEQRLAEILVRYSPDDPVHRAIQAASGDIRAAVSRVEQRLAELL